MAITLLIDEDDAGTVEWAQEFNLSHPVVNDVDREVTYRFIDGSLGVPSMQLIAPGGEVLERDTQFGNDTVIDVLEQYN
jgi:hypothetical protein